MAFIERQVIPMLPSDSPTNGKHIDEPDELLYTAQLEKDLENWRLKDMVRAAKDIASSQWAVPTLLVIILGYWVYSDQKDTKVIDSKSEQIEQIKKDLQEQTRLLTRLDTLREVDEKQKQTDKEQKQRQIEIDQAWRETLTQSFNEIRTDVNNRLGIKNRKD